MKNLLGHVQDKKSLAMAGVEQFALDMLPPDFLALCMLHALDTMGTHGAMVLQESVVSVKSSLLEGLANLQHHPERLIDCVKNLLPSFLTWLKHPDHLNHFLTHIDQHPWHAISPALNFDTIVHALDPLMNTHQHIGEIKQAVATHAVDAGHSIGVHAVEHYHIDPGGHFPFIRLAMSSAREWRLLQEDKTDFGTAVKNITLDVGGVGLGALGGGKAGAVIGTAICPGLGTAIGGMLGAIFGGIFGKMGSDRVKYLDLKDAVKSYEQAYATAMYELNNSAREAVHSLRQESARQKKVYQGQIGAVPMHDPNCAEMGAMALRLATEYNHGLSRGQIALRLARRSVFSVLPRFRSRIAVMRNTLKRLRNAVPSKLQLTASPVEAMHRLAGLSSPENSHYPEMLEKTAAELHQLNAAQQDRLVLWTIQAGATYRKSIQAVIGKLKVLAEKYNDKCHEWKDELESELRTVNYEKGKLGLA